MAKKYKAIQNLLANYVAAFVNVAAPLIMLPLYITQLGVTQWGAISLAFLTQSLMAIVDSGLSQALTREFSARSSDLCGLKKAYTTCTISNIILVLLISAMAVGIIEFNRILFPSGATLKYDAWLYGVMLFCTSSIFSVSRSLLIAMERQVLVSGINVIFAILRHAVAFILIEKYRSIEYFFLCHIVAQGIESAVRFVAAHKIIKPNIYIFDHLIFKGIRNFLFGITIAVIVGALTFNLERFIVSAMVSLDTFGIYSVAATLGTGVIQLIYPITQAFFPSLMRHNIVETKRIVLRLMAGATFILITCWAFYSTHGEGVLKLYLKGGDTTEIFPLLTVYLAGSSINFFWSISQLVVMKEGNHRLIVNTSMVNLIVIGSFCPVMLGNYGIKYVPYIFLVTNIIGLIVASTFAAKIFKHEN